MTHWITSSRSQNTGTCVEITTTLDRVRDAKNPHGPVLHVNVTTLVHAIKTGRFDLDQ